VRHLHVCMKGERGMQLLVAVRLRSSELFFPEL
jgi:hypothetical protein